ncbi:hypothetical protein ACFWN1_33065, partial [Streptomyces sp. NPDC058459]|uniref:hypothetical protein n=1 Tax=Streptomyces sp. NPDC058459 TaxID=3346508 RepID=UPI00364976DA
MDSPPTASQAAPWTSSLAVSLASSRTSFAVFLTARRTCDGLGRAFGWERGLARGLGRAAAFRAAARRAAD